MREFSDEQMLSFMLHWSGLNSRRGEASERCSGTCTSRQERKKERKLIRTCSEVEQAEF